MFCQFQVYRSDSVIHTCLSILFQILIVNLFLNQHIYTLLGLPRWLSG